MTTEYLQTAIDAAKEGGMILKKYWGSKLSVKQKSFSWDLVTQADSESETAITRLILENHPQHSILGEEGGLKNENAGDYLWMIDPLDGTTNYVHNYPMFCVSIALYYQKQPLVSVVYHPVYNELFHSEKGKGSYLNGISITVSDVETIQNSLLVTGFAYNRTQTQDNNYREFCHMTSISQGVRRSGSAALDLAYVAAGRLDGFWEQGLKPWDIAAGNLLVAEAGGLVTTYKKDTFDIFSGNILATNGKIHDLMIEELR